MKRFDRQLSGLFILIRNICSNIIIYVLSKILYSIYTVQEGLVMSIKDIVKISVRELVEYVLKSGDITSGFCSTSRLTDAMKAHQAIQKFSGEGYLFEVPVSYSVNADDLVLEINGRIDGVIRDGDTVIIDEIKTTTAQLEAIDEFYNHLHMAQVKCYAFIYASLNGLSDIGVQLTYYHMETGETKKLLKYMSFKELELFFSDLIGRYIKWMSMLKRWQMKRNSSIKALEFPFSSYRKGQRELAVSAYRAIRDGSKLFVQAPTGIGKTISVLFPAVKALGEGVTSKVFYLTARTTTRLAAEDAFERMREAGLCIKTLTLTAKEKICFCPESQCHPDFCEYSKGYYDRIGEAVEDIFKNDSFTRDTVEEYARKHNVCPFEYSLELSLWSDCIICDYNYAFDPRVYLKRFFLDSGSDYCFLIDEAHNLLDRSREMFSAKLGKKLIMDMKKLSKDEDRDIYTALKDINNHMIKLRKECQDREEDYMVMNEQDKDLYKLLRKLLKAAESYLSKGHQNQFRQELLDLYFETAAFLKISENYDDTYVTYVEKSSQDMVVKLFCVDPSHVLREGMKRCSSAVFFSATLSPMDYFTRIYGGDENCSKLRLPSPYLSENLCLIIDSGISTKYRVREFTYDRVADSIAAVAKGKTGNYLVYFPSYRYMQEVYIRFCSRNPAIDTVCQTSGMSDKEREEFLSLFASSPGDGIVGFAVMGGIFGEGIDLVGDRLSGVIVVGVGLPQVCLEREIIRRYFDENNGVGFEYAYIYPGLVKVMQAVGRVIRSENDRGVALLLDERFSVYNYQGLLPGEWDIRQVRDTGSIPGIINDFWDEDR